MGRRASALLVAILLSASAAGQSPSGDGSARPSTFERIRDGVVHVGQAAGPGSAQIEQWLGTGFLVDSACTIVTAKHLFDLADRGRIVVRYQVPPERRKVRTLAATILWDDPSRDLAFLRITSSDGKPCVAEDLRKLSLATLFDPRQFGGEDVRIVGFPRLGPYDVDLPIVRAGIVASAEGTDSAGKPLLLLDLAGVPGFSGSPVVLARTGEVIGVVYGPGLIDRGASFEFATPFDALGYAAAMEALSKSVSPAK